jgi:hypothetical protein
VHARDISKKKLCSAGEDYNFHSGFAAAADDRARRVKERELEEKTGVRWLQKKTAGSTARVGKLPFVSCSVSAPRHQPKTEIS